MSKPIQFYIDERDAGCRVDEFCASRYGALSRMRIANLIEAGGCLVNGAPARRGYRLSAGDLLVADFENGAPGAMHPDPIALEVVYEDEQIIVVVKPPGMLVHPTIGVKTGTLANALSYHLNKSRLENRGLNVDAESLVSDSRSVIRPGLVHRLDRATSGLMVIAKTARSLTTLSRHFRRRLVEKRYIALVHGLVKSDSGAIEAPIGRDPEAQPHWRVMEGGKPAETRFNVLKRNRMTTLLELEPVTGRTNQLRIHCAHIGHAIVGDDLHGNLELRMPNRLCLHACKLAFHHPVSGEWMEFSSDVRDGFLECAASRE